MNIHYVNARLTQKEKLKVIARRGRKAIEETQPMQYNSINSNVIFEYPLNFEITMHKKGDKYVKKFINFRLIELQGEKCVENGKAEFDFSDLANYGLLVNHKDLFLKGCSDKSAVICISMSLIQINKPRAKTGVHSSANQISDHDLSLQHVSQNANRVQFSTIQSRRAVKIVDSDGEPFDILSQSTIINSNKDFEILVEEVQNSTKSHQVSKDTDFLDHRRNQRSGTVPYSQNNQETPYKEDKQERGLVIDTKFYLAGKSPGFEGLSPIRPDNLSARKKSFTVSDPTSPTTSINRNDMISQNARLMNEIDIAKQKQINPKDSMVDSEDSSSEEELLDVSTEILPSPIGDMNYSKPNIKSQEKELEIKEQKSGISTAKKSVCSGCSLF